MNTPFSIVGVVGLILQLGGCGSTPKIGEACSVEGSTSECESAAACGKLANGKLLCQKQCTDQAQCASSESCNGLTGSSIKTCRTK
jgi:hypothetical protein